MKIFDLHAHTGLLSYCCDELVTVDSYAEAIEFNDALAGVAITDHGFAAYFPEEVAWEWDFISDPSIFDKYIDFGNRRLTAHFDLLEQYSHLGILKGLECEMMCDGRLTVTPELRHRVDVLLGSLHVAWGGASTFSASRAYKFFLNYNQGLIDQGVDVIAHPFRWLIDSAGLRPDYELVRDLVQMAKDGGVALEVNGRGEVVYDILMLESCIELGVPITFGTDCHNLCEIGRFEYHMSLLKVLGIDPGEMNFWQPKIRKAVLA